MTTAGCLPDLLRAEEASPSTTENGSAQGSHPFSISPSNFPFFFQGAPVQPCFQQCKSAEPGAWCSFLAAEETRSVVTTVVPALLKKSTNQGWFECPQPDFLSFEKATQ